MANSKLVTNWFKFAARDLKMAKLSLSSGSDYKNISAFHSQQCAEKAIKGFLTHKKIRFSKTHDLLMLSVEIQTVDTKLAKIVEKSKALTDYAVFYRYPDAADNDLTLSNAKSALKLSQKVYDACYTRVFEV